jgi:hypothetical protein
LLLSAAILANSASSSWKTNCAHWQQLKNQLCTMTSAENQCTLTSVENRAHCHQQVINEQTLVMMSCQYRGSSCDHYFRRYLPIPGKSCRCSRNPQLWLFFPTYRVVIEVKMYYFKLYFYGRVLKIIHNWSDRRPDRSLNSCKNDLVRRYIHLFFLLAWVYQLFF